MAFKLGNRMIEKVLYGYAENSKSELLYTLDQLTDTVINITAEANEHKDADGNLVKKSYKNKAGTLEAKNAFVNTNIVAATSGADVKYGEKEAITAPKIIITNSGITKFKYEDDIVDGTIHITIEKTGEALTKDTTAEPPATAATGTFVVNKTKSTILLPDLGEEASAFVIRYDRKVKTGALIVNSADKFPTSCRLILKVAYWDTCEKETLKGCYVVIPSFQVSPEISLPLNSETQMDYKGDLETDYCGAEKVLYKFYDIADDEN